MNRDLLPIPTRQKPEFLGVLPATLQAHGAVSEPVVEEMAIGALAAAGANIAVSVSGIAGPGSTEFKPEGRVCFALKSSQMAHSETVEFGAIGRAEVRKFATNHALELISKVLKTAY